MWQVLFFIFLTTLFWGVSPILEKYGLGLVDPITAVYIRSVVVFILLSAYYLSTRGISSLIAVSPKAVIAFTLSGLFAGLLGMWTYFKALQVSPSSKVVPLVATYPLITAILGVLILGEKFSWQRFLGTALIVLGVLLVK